MTRRKPMTISDILTSPTVVDLITAARALGIGRTAAYRLAQDGDFPCPVITVGGVYRVPTAGLARLLGIDPADLAASTTLPPARPSDSDRARRARRTNRRRQ
ncbi:helix-turn-helix transcriptional regulator [Actinocatenispora rupis]|uniref:Helix-turn-helix domain-containing protein n=1 Tax=Actinocatenispora rupis TaxID=519421 RepID=A0A8J3N8E7_9ACTN|nr:helix-turn-helix domain-containing protein [Actinocatenispora rupis]GID10234.1 hypothetical protein Aru02nite_11230 [Actinocatenispora rupis]